MTCVPLPFSPDVCSPVEGTRYYVSFMVVNTVGLILIDDSPHGLLFTAVPPATRPARLGHSDQVGLHLSYDNTVSGADYTLDGGFFDPVAALQSGTLTLVVCSAATSQATGGQACSVANSVLFDGEPPSVTTVNNIILSHGDVYHAEATWCNEAGLCTNLTSQTTMVICLRFFCMCIFDVTV